MVLEREGRETVMILQSPFDVLWEYSFLGIPLVMFFWMVIIVVVAVVLERLITLYLRRFAKRVHLEANVTNNLILTSRVLILVGVVASVFRVGGLPAEWLVTFSAVSGAAIGLASTKTIGNFIAGLYLLAAHPFRVGDYVRIGTVEGIVNEVTINYTKILTIGNNIVSISNLQVMDRDITNYAYQSTERAMIYCYNFEIGFDHQVSTIKIAEIFDEVFERYAHVLPKKPSYMLVRSGAFERVYLVYLYVEHPQDVFVFRPLIAEEVFKRWDVERAKLFRRK